MIKSRNCLSKFISVVLAIGVTISLFTGQFLKVYADNPIIQTAYTADPAPVVIGDTLYVYTSHDADDTINGFFTMDNLLCYSTTDMVNWTDHGVVMNSSDFSWAKKNTLWAAQVIERNDKYYAYVPIERSSGAGPAIGVGVSDSPTGRFTDPLDRPLVFAGTWAGDIDPTVFIDDDGQAYLYWGNPQLYYVKLNEDMISYSGEIVKVPMAVESFGPRTNTDRATSYEEGPWLYKRNDIYYLVYAGGPITEHIAYATSNSPTGPWVYGGIIMSRNQTGAAFTNHPGVVDYKGHSYLFYHNQRLPGGGGYHRSVAIEEFTYNEDGTFPEINMTNEGPAAIANLNPYIRNEAETIAWSSGIDTQPSSQGGMSIYNVHNNDYIKIGNVDFGTDGAGTFIASVACGNNSVSTREAFVELYLDNRQGTPVGILPISYTGGWDNWTETAASIAGATGVHDLYLVFKGHSNELVRMDYWRFVPQTTDKTITFLDINLDRFEIDKVTGSNAANLAVTAFYSDGTNENVTAQAQVEATTNGIVSFENNNSVITGIGYGETEIEVSFEGMKRSVSIQVVDLSAKMTVESLSLDKDSVSLKVGKSVPLTVTANFVDGHTEDVTLDAEYSYSTQGIADVSDGNITGLALGETVVTISYTGLVGEPAEIELPVTVTLLNPYTRNEAEDFDDKNGELRAEDCGDIDGGQNVGYIEDGMWLLYNGVDFGSNGPVSFTARVAAQYGTPSMSLRLDAPDAEPIATLRFASNGQWQVYKDETVDITANVTGVHDLYITFGGPQNINWWKFTEDKTADKTALSAAIKSAEELREEDYTAASWAELMEALEAAREVYEDPDASKEEVEAAEAALRRAIEALEEYVEPEVPVESLKITNGAMVELRRNTTLELDVVINPEDATDAQLTWSASATCVSVDEDGVVTAHRAGMAIITVQAANGVKATVTVRVL